MSWFQEQMSAKFESKHWRLGKSEGTVDSIKILNRTVRYTEEGLVYDADEKHARSAIKSLGLEQARSVYTPAVREYAERKGVDLDEVDVQVLVHDWMLSLGTDGKYCTAIGGNGKEKESGK